jgi:hypothetical protein
MVEAILLVIAVRMVQPTRKVEEASQDVLGHSARISVAARGRDDHVTAPQIRPQ